MVCAYARDLPATIEHLSQAVGPSCHFAEEARAGNTSAPPRTSRHLGALTERVRALALSPSRKAKKKSLQTAYHFDSDFLDIQGGWEINSLRSLPAEGDYPPISATASGADASREELPGSCEWIAKNDKRKQRGRGNSARLSERQESVRTAAGRQTAGN